MHILAVWNQKMYEKYGFKFRGIQKLYYENTGWADFLFYEMNIYNGAEHGQGMV